MKTKNTSKLFVDAKKKFIGFDCIRCQTGALSILGVFLLMVLSLTICGVTLMSKRINAKIGAQLELDRCIFGQTQKIKKIAETIERTNQQMHTIRLAIGSQLLIPNPTMLATSRAALKALVILQEKNRVIWNVSVSQWNATMACSEQQQTIGGIMFSIFPLFPWKRLPPDILGDKPLSLEGRSSFEMRVFNRGQYVRSTSHIFREDKDWIAQWGALPKSRRLEPY